MFKRILAELMALVMILSTGVTAFAQDKTDDTEEVAEIPEDGVILSLDFENNIEGLSISGATMETKTIGEGNKAYAYTAGKSVTAYMGKHYKQNLPKGIYKISYDWYTESPGGSSLLRLLNENSDSVKNTDYSNTFAILQMSGDNFIDVRRRYSTWWKVDYGLETPYETGKWYSVEVWIDTANRDVCIYINDEMVVHMPLSDDVKELRGFAIASEPRGSKETYMYYDNLEFVKVQDNNNERMNPVYVRADAPETVISNNFSKDDPARFNLTLTNRLKEAVDAKIFYRVYTNYKPELVWSSEDSAENISIPAGGTINHSMKVGREYYGRLNLDIVTVVDGKEYKRTVPYTMSNHTKDMPVNKNSGIAGHLGSGRGSVDLTLPLLNLAGIGWLRDNYSLQWGNIEKEKGVYTFTEEMDRWLDLLEENDISLVYLWEQGNTWTYPDPKLGTGRTIFPTTEEGVKGLENFIEALVKWADGRIDVIECYNEFQNYSDIYKPERQHMVNYHKAIYKGAKKADPNVQVIGGNVDNWAIYDYFTAVLEGIKGETTLDGIANHPYHPTGGAPEKGVVSMLIGMVNDYLVEYGFEPGLPHYMTEIGWSSSDLRDENGEFDDAKYTSYEVRSAATIRAESETLGVNSIQFKYCDYDYTMNEKRGGDKQAHFGLLENYDGATCEIPALGKSIFPAISYYNGLVAEGDFIKNIETDYGEKAFAYQYKLRGGEDLLMFGAVEDDTHLTFAYDLGVNSVTVGDMYGNEQTYTSDNGIYTFEAYEDDIIYVKGSFNKVETAEARFAPEVYEIVVPINYDFTYEVKTPQNFSGTAEVEGVGVTAKQKEVKVSDGKVVFKFHTGNESIADAKIKINITDNDKNTVYQVNVPIEHTASGVLETDVKYRPSGGRYDLWDMHISIRNIREDVPIAGKITVDNTGRQYVIPTINPGELRKVVIPKQQVSSMEELGALSAKITLSTGEEINIEKNGAMNGLIYAEETPVIDGILADGEWDDVGMFALTMDEAKYVYSEKGNGEKAPWSGPEDAMVEAYLKYDEENLYMGAKIYDDVYRQVNEYNKLWNGDSMQILVGRDVDVSGTQYGVGLDKDGVPRIYRNTWEGWKSGLGTGAVAGLYENGEVAITRDGVWTYYEVKLPLKDFSFEQLPINAGDYIYFDILYNDDDGNDRECWIDLVDCIGSSGNRNRDAVRTLMIPKRSQ